MESTEGEDSESESRMESESEPEPDSDLAIGLKRELVVDLRPGLICKSESLSVAELASDTELDLVDEL